MFLVMQELSQTLGGGLCGESDDRSGLRIKAKGTPICQPGLGRLPTYREPGDIKVAADHSI